MTIECSLTIILKVDLLCNFVVNPLAAPSSYFVCARILAQKLTYLPTPVAAAVDAQAAELLGLPRANFELSLGSDAAQSYSDASATAGESGGVVIVACMAR